MRKRNGDRLAERVAPADALCETQPPEQPAYGQPADGQDELRPEEPELPLEPERAQIHLRGRRRAIAAT